MSMAGKGGATGGGNNRNRNRNRNRGGGGNRQQRQQMTRNNEYGDSAIQNAFGANQNAMNMVNDAYGDYQGFVQGGGGQYNPWTMGDASYTAAPDMQGQNYNAATRNAAQWGNTANMDAAGYNASNMNAANQGAAQGFNAAGYNAANQQGPQSIASLMDRYTNPYENQVVDRTTAQMQKDRDMAQQQNRANAAASGAFGGGRHGVVEAVTNAETNQQIGDMAANMRHQGFNTAAGLAGQDIGNTMQVNSQNQAAQNAQRAFNAGNQQQANAYLAQAQNDRNQFNAGNQQQANMQNQDAQNAQLQYNAGNRQDANRQNSIAENQRRQYNTTNTQDMRQANMDAINRQREFGAGNRQQADMQNMMAENNRRQFNTNMDFNRMQNNMDARNQSRQYNAGVQNSNMSNLFNSAMSGAGQLGGLGQQAFDMYNTTQQNNMMSGAMSQGMNQNIMNQAQQMFQQYANQPQNILNQRLNAIGQNPMGSTGTSSSTQPSNIAGNLLGAAGNMFQFSPIALPWSSARFKEDIVPTGETARSVSGKEVPVVTYRYRNSPVHYRGVIAEDLGPNDPATHNDLKGDPIAVDYSKLEVL